MNNGLEWVGVKKQGYQGTDRCQVTDRIGGRRAVITSFQMMCPLPGSTGLVAWRWGDGYG